MTNHQLWSGNSGQVIRTYQYKLIYSPKTAQFPAVKLSLSNTLKTKKTEPLKVQPFLYRIAVIFLPKNYLL